MRKLFSLIAVAIVSSLMGCCHDTCDSCREVCSSCGGHGGHVVAAPADGAKQMPNPGK